MGGCVSPSRRGASFPPPAIERDSWQKKAMASSRRRQEDTPPSAWQCWFEIAARAGGGDEE
jgi:hypothetical protein